MEHCDIENFDPSACISGKIMRISRVISSIFRKHLQPYNITGSQVSLLFMLSRKKEISQKELASLAKLEKSSLNRNLTRLVEKGFINKEQLPTVKLTESGKEFIQTLIPVWSEAMKETREILNQDGEDALNLLVNKLLK